MNKLKRILNLPLSPFFSPDMQSCSCWEPRFYCWRGGWSSTRLLSSTPRVISMSITCRIRATSWVRTCTICSRTWTRCLEKKQVVELLDNSHCMTL